MALSIVEIAAAHLFEIEPDDEQWQLKIECAVHANDQWETVSLPISKERLLTSTEQASARRALIEELRAPVIRVQAARITSIRVFMNARKTFATHSSHDA